jgi:predicted small secreted protein
MKARAICLLIAACVAIAGVPLFVVGCSTTEGFGKDVKILGSDIENKAAEKKNDSSSD